MRTATTISTELKADSTKLFSLTQKPHSYDDQVILLVLLETEKI